MNTQAGLVVVGSQNTLGSEQDVHLQGAATGQTLILIDGIPAYDPSGTSTNFDLNLINTDEVERVEILVSQSTLYGSDAVAGVINIITKKGEGKPLNASVNLSGGSFGTWKAGLGLDGKIGGTGYNVQYTHMKSDGLSAAYDSAHTGTFDHDGFKEDLLMVNLTQKVSDAFQLRGNFQYNHYNTDLDAGAYTDDKGYTATNKNAQGGIGADYTIGAGALHFNYNYNTVTRNYTDDSATMIALGGTYSNSSYTGRSHYTELYGNFSLSKYIDLMAGVDYRNQQVSENTLFIYYNNFSPPYGPVNSFSAINSDSARVRQFAGYASLLLKNLGGFHMELGGRYNSFNKYGNVATYSLSTRPMSSTIVGKCLPTSTPASPPPTLYQLYSQYADPFGELKPEKTTSVETGLQYSVRTFNARAVYFNRYTKDNIIYYANDPNYPNGYYINLDKQKDHGIELEANGKVGIFNFTANYTYTTGQVTTPVNGKDSTYYNLYRIPKNIVNLGAGVQITPGMYFSTALRSVGKRIESVYGGPPTSVDAGGYYTVDGYLEYKICQHVKAFFDGKNLTNQQYFDIPGFTSKRINFMAGINVRC